MLPYSPSPATKMRATSTYVICSSRRTGCKMYFLLPQSPNRTLGRLLHQPIFTSASACSPPASRNLFSSCFPYLLSKKTSLHLPFIFPNPISAPQISLHDLIPPHPLPRSAYRSSTLYTGPEHHPLFPFSAGNQPPPLSPALTCNLPSFRRWNDPTASSIYIHPAAFGRNHLSSSALYPSEFLKLLPSFDLLVKPLDFLYYSLFPC